ncbi:MAG: 16S rRNA (cytidine(1402)-2'-O)-methyltransferase [Bacteroidetes bacterium GWF2_49_14]|nr:MAG: 16S rRNA (cytidine(1402)-2'-O)-methyltransferase [Bacteroidetes bacterium GWF2_49_14]HBB92164.1 16S rRNA (cytidine(1402)-2'-O)-methyltransferase [Bacteroidales bacterium]
MTDRDVRLYIVPTPIGNLADITYRAVKVLNEVDFILAEDTRTSGTLLKRYEIHKPMVAHHKFNEHKSVQRIVERLASGERAALITDAGTPGISDPGFLLTRACIQEGVEVECLPGATALIPALVNSGFPCDRFIFEGFLPVKKGRQTRIRELASEGRTVILYESPMRLAKTLLQLIPAFGEDRRCSVSRELSKMHEETVRGTLTEIAAWAGSKTMKGEIVLVIEGR